MPQGCWLIGTGFSVNWASWAFSVSVIAIGSSNPNLPRKTSPQGSTFGRLLGTGKFRR